MKKTMIRVALLALAALLALSLVACGDDGDYKQFSINEEHTVITDGTNTYTLHELPRGFYRGPVLGETPVCQYKNPLEWEPHYAMDLSEPGGDSGILYATYYVALKDAYFATDEAEAELQAFFAGDYPQFALDPGNQHRPPMLVPAAQKDAILAGYAASTVTLDVDVTTLDALVFSSWFTLVATDKTGTFKTDIGAILVTEDGCYYVDFATLDQILK